MINSRSSTRICGGELLLYPLPVGGEDGGRVVVKMFDSLYKHEVIHLNKPPSEKVSESQSGHEKSEMGNDESLGGESDGFAIC